MYREWKSGASFRKARPACEFTTSWKYKVRSLCLYSTSKGPINPLSFMTTTLTDRYIQLYSTVTFRDELNNNPHLSFFPGRQNPLLSEWEYKSNLNIRKDCLLYIFCRIACFLKLWFEKKILQVLLGEVIHLNISSKSKKQNKNTGSTGFEMPFLFE